MTGLLSILKLPGETQGSLWTSPLEEFQREMCSATQKGPAACESTCYVKVHFSQDSKIDKKKLYALHSAVKTKMQTFTVSV